MRFSKNKKIVIGRCTSHILLLVITFSNGQWREIIQGKMIILIRPSLFLALFNEEKTDKNVSGS